MEQEGSSAGLDSESIGLESGAGISGDDDKKDAAVKSSIDLATGKGVKGSVTPAAAKTTAPSEKEKEEQNAVDKTAEKVQEKITDFAKEKVQDKVKDVLGDPEKGKEELGEVVIDAVNEANAKRAGRVAVGKKASQVSTTVAANSNVAPLVVSHPNAAVASNVAPTTPPKSGQAAASAASSQTSQRIASGAGKGVPPSSASSIPTPSVGSRASGMLDELMSYGRDLSSAVFKGAKESKNIRMLGLATLAGATGWAVGKNKDAKKAQEQEFNRQQAIRQSLMSDG